MLLLLGPVEKALLDALLGAAALEGVSLGLLGMGEGVLLVTIELEGGREEGWWMEGGEGPAGRLEGVFLLAAAEGVFTYSFTVLRGALLVVVEEGGIEEGRCVEGGGVLAEGVFFWDGEVLLAESEGLLTYSPTVAAVFLGAVEWVFLVLAEAVMILLP